MIIDTRVSRGCPRTGPLSASSVSRQQDTRNRCLCRRPATPSCDTMHTARILDDAHIAHRQCFVRRVDRLVYPLALSTLRLSFTLSTNCSLVIFELGSRFLYRPVSIASCDLPVWQVGMGNPSSPSLSLTALLTKRTPIEKDRKVTYFLQPPPQLRISPRLRVTLRICLLRKHIAVPHVPQ